MTNLNINTIEAPQPIKDKLENLSESYNFERQSDKGANSWLFFGRNIVSNQSIALKFYDWSGDTKYHAEPRNLVSLQSNNVISILSAEIVNGDYAYFITPFLSKGDLDDKISRGFRANIRAVKLAREILSGLSHLHSKCLLHRDLKPENIFLSDDDRAVIGDFGSVKQIPDGETTVPGSGHSLIYRPPESVSTGIYGIPGDLHQVGVVLYQLLGGSLPYREDSWLNQSELKRYRKYSDPIDRQVFANDIIKKKIERGQILKMNSLPPWVCVQLKRLISKATNIDPSRRFQSCSEFMAQISSIFPHIHDWQIQDGYPTHNGKRVQHRIFKDQKTGQEIVQKRCTGNWRTDNSIKGDSTSDLVKQIEAKNS